MSVASIASVKHSTLFPPDFGPLQAAAWQALNDHSGAWVMLVRADGIVLHVNDVLLAAVRVNRDDVIGQHVSRIIHPTCVEERVSYYAKVAQEGAPLCIEGIIGGGLVRCCLHPILASVPGELPCTLCVSRAIAPDAPPPGIPVVRARCDDRGPLASLSERELDVLRLIGRGMTTAQIARELHRSVKTIEWHRVSLGTKLGASNRVELARIAIRYGLASPFDGFAAETSTLATDAPK